MNSPDIETDKRHEGVMALRSVEAQAEAAGYQLARRQLHGQKVWWWQHLDDPEDTDSRARWNGGRH